MTPYERCVASNCCPIGLAFYIRDPERAQIFIDMNTRPSFNPVINLFSKKTGAIDLREGLFITSGQAQAIISAWDNDFREYAAEMAESLGLI